MNKSKIMLAVNTAFIGAVFVLNYFYQSNGFDFTLKCVCSGLFALLGVINLCYALASGERCTRFYVLMTLGLVLAMLGDIFIAYDFIAGAATFAMGHICFIIAYCFLQSIGKRDLIISGALFLFGGGFLLFCPILTFENPIFKVVCVVYALIISLMLGKALGNYAADKTKATGTMAVASALFYFSDFMLVLDWFIGRWDWTSEACMGTYYPALCLLALSMYFKTREEKSIK